MSEDSIQENYNNLLDAMAKEDRSSSKLDFENGVQHPFPADNVEDASAMLKPANCDTEAAINCVRAARGEKIIDKKIDKLF